MFIPKVDLKQKRVKGTQNTKTQKLGWSNSPRRWLARHGGRDVPPVTTLLAVASSPARRGGQTWLSVTTLLASRASLLAVASTDSWLSRKTHSSPQNPNFEPLNSQIDFQNLSKHVQTLKGLQNHMKFEPKHLSNQNSHLTHFCKHSQEHSIFLTNLNDYDHPSF